jgi:flagellar biogenesis protein FliO
MITFGEFIAALLLILAACYVLSRIVDRIARVDRWRDAG